jgi:hypothetical protein
MHMHSHTRDGRGAKGNTGRTRTVERSLGWTSWFDLGLSRMFEHRSESPIPLQDHDVDVFYERDRDFVEAVYASF